MSEIVVIGNSLAAVSAIEQIRRDSSSARITLICPEGVLPYRGSLVSDLVAKDLRESQIYIKPEKFFGDQQVTLVLDESPSRISVKRQQVTTEKKAHFPFDQLLLADLPPVQLPALKGHHKKGVFDAFLLSSARELMKYLAFVDTVLVPVTNFDGFNMACAIRRLGKETLVLSPGPGVLGAIFDEETAMLLKQIVESKGIRVIDDGIEEVLGDTEVKAARLKSGKVMAAQAVVFDVATPDLKILADSGLVHEGRLPTQAFFNTAQASVFACGHASSGYPLSPEELIEQGRVAGANILHLGAMAYQAPLVIHRFGSRICDGFCGGLLRLQEGGREHMKFDGPTNIYKKIFLLEGCLIGAVWFNAAQDKDRVLQALAQKKSLAGQEDEFL